MDRVFYSGVAAVNQRRRRGWERPPLGASRVPRAPREVEAKWPAPLLGLAPGVYLGGGVGIPREREEREKAWQRNRGGGHG